ncbi:MAG: hypothetical protein V4710_21170 [Verrucomicrobiota bacterium]
MILLRRIRWLLGAFIAGLVLSGVTAFPLRHELDLLAAMLGVGDVHSPAGHSGLTWWILRVREALEVTYERFPFIAYGTDWLAFGHIVIALFFIGPWLDPVRNVSAIYVGMVACVGVIPLALICGPIREIPFYWRLIDCAFGIIGILPLWLVLRFTAKLEKSEAAGKSPAQS